MTDRELLALALAAFGLLVVAVIASRIRGARRRERGDGNLKIDLHRRD